MRIPALVIERAVKKEMAALLADPMALIGLTTLPVSRELLETASVIAEQATEKPLRNFIRTLIERIEVQPAGLQINFAHGAMAELLGIDPSAIAPSDLCLSIPTRLKRSGHSFRLISDDGVKVVASSPDPALLGHMLTARRWWSELSQGKATIAALARAEGVSASWMTRVVRLAFLSPQVVDAILAGQQPAALDGRALLSTDAIDPNWSMQARQLLRSSEHQSNG